MPLTEYDEECFDAAVEMWRRWQKGLPTDRYGSNNEQEKAARGIGLMYRMIQNLYAEKCEAGKASMSLAD